MKRNETNGLAKPLFYGRHSYLSRMFNILDSDDCSKGLMIAISLLDQKNFLYFNKAFRSFIGKKIDALTDQGWEYWYQSICSQEAPIVKNRIRNFFGAPYDRKPITLRYHLYDWGENLIYLRHEIILYKLGHTTMALNYFYDVSEKERLENCLHIKRERDIIDEENGKGLISSREKEVLQLVAEGHSSKQIADILFISNHTAISHRKHLIEKFKVKNTAQLIKKASKIMEL
ncbi:helix-turn-helix transcriptional regulator [Aggregatimonas sangjinii]|uniref:Helix-turn-helix transcriptional regulator n=1 Tax=Aggregatimonas sangjinii TaxID=2583587 RepID=A0A5B7SW85_9FLAO|nr:helix-turn-helix transcriptional regulator [Aggregatimonas sangjinii]QCX00954.1 helix-turn-helix transcriptional regulator [Aggregatimonas sangjinii]